jgi:hypothetical protein
MNEFITCKLNVKLKKKVDKQTNLCFHRTIKGQPTLNKVSIMKKEVKEVKSSKVTEASVKGSYPSRYNSDKTDTKSMKKDKPNYPSRYK